MVLLSNKDVSSFNLIDLIWFDLSPMLEAPLIIDISFELFISIFHTQFLAQLILLIHNANSKTRPFSLTLKRCKYKKFQYSIVNVFVRISNLVWLLQCNRNVNQLLLLIFVSEFSKTPIEKLNSVDKAQSMLSQN